MADVPQDVKTRAAGDVVAKIVGDDGTSVLDVDATFGAAADVKRLPSGSQAAATAKTADYDTGAGTDTVPMQGIALPASGGAVAGGTATNPVRMDPTGTTAQPVTDGGGSLTIDTDDGPIDVNIVSGGASTPQRTQDTSAALAAAANDTLVSAAVTNTETGRLQQVVCSGSGPGKWEIGLSTNGTALATTVATVYTSAADPTVVWTPPAQNVTQVGDGTKAWAARVTNRDNAAAADYAATFLWDEVA